MKFYEIDNALQEAIENGNKPIKVKIEIDMGGHFESVFEQDIIEANFYCLKEAAGGVSSRGEVLLAGNCYQVTGNNEEGAGKEVRVSFSVGEGLPYFQRFVFYIDDKGIQDIRGPGCKRYVRLELRDLSSKLRKTDETRDWTAPAVFTYSVICDKAQPGKSLVHGIAQRAGLSVADIDCSTIPVTLPYVRLRRNIWAELSSMATAYRCHLECAPEKPLVFAHSPYQINEQGADNNEQSEDPSYTFYGDNIFYLRKTERLDLYKNTVRLKINLPLALEKQEIWRYEDPPVFYDEYLQAHYPFKYPLVREVEGGKYEGRYQVAVSSEQGIMKRPVVYADQIDTKEEAENRLEYDGGDFSYSFYDITTNYDRAVLTIHREADGDLYKAAIFGKPIILDLNRSCFVKDTEGINTFGTVALNVTGSYFSEYEINGRPQYEDWVMRELAERIQNKREFTVKTHRALFNARVGSKVKVKSEKVKERFEAIGNIMALSFRYKRDEAFVAWFKIR